MIKVIIIGAGNVATSLYRSFLQVEEIKILQVYNRNPEHLTFVEDPSKKVSDLQNLKSADLYILAVKDDAIKEVAKELPALKGMVVHTSGTESIDALNSFENYGVFYPLQTFSKEKTISFKDIPVCIEANSQENNDLLKKLAKIISDQVYEVDSDQRKALHLSAVFVNNFTNHLFTIAADYCREQELPFKILQPLIKETIKKIEALTPFSAQTGPAIRNDEKTIKAHLELLEGDRKKIYSIITESIQNLHGKEL